MPIPLIALIAAGAGMGAMKNNQEKHAFEEQQKVQAATTRYSPWTNMTAAAPVMNKGAIANIGAGAMSGYLAGQGMAGEGMPGAPTDGEFANEAMQNSNPSLMGSGWSNLQSSNIAPTNSMALGGTPQYLRRSMWQGFQPRITG